MNVCIVGSSGYISGFIIGRLKKQFPNDSIIKLDKVGDYTYYLDLEEVSSFDFSNIKDAEYIIFTAAISGPDLCAKEYDKCYNINVKGTSEFISKAIQMKKRVLFFSSDAVFGTDKGVPFDEDSKTNANTPYGIMKKVIEDMFKDSNYFKAIRLSYVVSKYDKFSSYCLKCIENDEVAEIFHPFYRNCITISDVLDTVMWLKEHWDEYQHSFLNIAGTELVSRIRIADEINRIMHNELQYKIIRPNGVFFNNRPQTTQMVSKYIYKLKIIDELNFTEKIRKEYE
ncbi:MAG: NAD-dependent epimerase/dehydratase family protein [Bacilli bacterium]